MSEGGGDIPKPEQEMNPEQGINPPYNKDEKVNTEKLQIKPPLLVWGTEIEYAQPIEDTEGGKAVEEKQRGIIMNVGEPGSTTFSVWHIKDDSIGLGAQSTHEVHRPFTELGHRSEQEIIDLVNRHYDRNPRPSFGNIAPAFREKLMAKFTPEAVKALNEKDRQRVIKLVRDLAQQPEEKKVRQVSLADFMQSIEEEESKKSNKIKKNNL